jgi:ankyrin repeat protein
MGDFWEAAKAGDLGEMEQLVARAPDLLDDRDNLLSTPLIRATRLGRLEVIRWMLDKGMAVNQPALASSDYHALWVACEEGRPLVVSLLF